jgi:hypothetical protein
MKNNAKDLIATLAGAGKPAQAPAAPTPSTSLQGKSNGEEETATQKVARVLGLPADMLKDLEALLIDRGLTPKWTGDTAEVLAKKYDLPEDLAKKLEEERKKNVGKKRALHNNAKLTEGDTRATFILKKDLVQKLKYISLIETRTLKDLLNDILGSYVAEWEGKHKPINIK